MCGQKTTRYQAGTLGRVAPAGGYGRGLTSGGKYSASSTDKLLSCGLIPPSVARIAVSSGSTTSLPFFFFSFFFFFFFFTVLLPLILSRLPFLSDFYLARPVHRLGLEYRRLGEILRQISVRNEATSIFSDRRPAIKPVMSALRLCAMLSVLCIIADSLKRIGFLRPKPPARWAVQKSRREVSIPAWLFRANGFLSR